MKKIILLLILLSSFNAFSQAKDSIYLGKPKVFSRPAPIVEYEIVQSVTKHSETQYEIITKLFTLRQGQQIFDLFARWENLTKQSKNIDDVKNYQKKLAEKELKEIGFHE